MSAINPRFWFPFVSCSLACQLNRGVGRIAAVGLLTSVAFVCLFFGWNVQAQSAGVQTDRAALVALYEATDGPNWATNTNWLSDEPLGSWYGVSTNSSGRVVSLYLKGRPGRFGLGSTPHGLSGQLPGELGNLSELTTLILGINNITGPIPRELGNLSELTQLNLEENNLSGEIPAELGTLTRLTALRLQNNQLSGLIPVEIGQLTRLTALDLSNNQISGVIPNELGNLTRLTILLLNGNFLIGELPDELGQLTNLRRFAIDGNSLSGPIPEWIGNFENLFYLSASDNRFRGEIPASIGNLTDLTQLNLSRNRLSGSLPSEIEELTDLVILNVYRNRLSGRISPALTKLTNLQVLDLGDNNLEGPVISGLRHMPDLQILYLSNNNLSGPVPTRFVDAPNLLLFSIAGNRVCVPGTHSFLFWLESVLIHDIYTLTFCNATDRSILERLFEATNGESWANKNGWGDNEVALERWYGIEADELGRVVSVNLGNNGLDGTLPLDLGYLARLRTLSINDNQLEGRLPLSLRRLELGDFQYANTELCVPVELGFKTWLDEVATDAGSDLSCDPLTEQDIMTMFFEETKGNAWTEASNWLSSEPLGEWHGVEVDDEGQVTSINIVANNLSGSIPLELARLSQLKHLNLEANALTGSIPPEIGGLTNLTSLNLRFNDLHGEIPVELGELENLTSLELSYNALSGSIPVEFGNLSNLITLVLAGNQLVGTIPSELANLENLNYLSFGNNRLHGSIPPELGELRNLTVLDLQLNALSGEIPAELGNLTNLSYLGLYANDFTGEIPPQIGDLTNLQTIILQYNRFSGELPREFGNLTALQTAFLSGNRFEGQIPSELGNLNQLRDLYLDGNRLTGEIPSELANLDELEILQLNDNDLTGPLPTELGDLEKLLYLHLNGNDLSGELPASLGRLSELRGLYLHENDFSGSIPIEFGGLTDLMHITLSRNSGLSGPIPIELTALEEIQVFLTVGTSICLPADQAFSEWLIRVYIRRIESCSSSGPLLAFLTQPVQSHDFPVPLVAGERALLRVFPISTADSDLRIPESQVRFFVDDQEIHSVSIASRVLATQMNSGPGNLESSTNVEIEGSVIRKGLELVLEIDSEDSAASDGDSSSGASTTTRLPVDVQDLPVFDLTLIPFVAKGSSDRSIVDLVNAMAANPREHEMLHDTRTLLPISEFDVKAHEPVETSSETAFELLAETSAIRAVEGGAGYYMGMKSEVSGGASGVAYIGGRDSFSIPVSYIVAHELGHNLNLRHAPCGGPAGPDRSFPYTDGTVGSWGYDFRDGGSVVQPSTPDLMSYCTPVWISDYHFSNALRFRMFLQHRSERTVMSARPSLLVWGGQNANSELVLKPSFVVHAPPILPDSHGEFEINIHSTTGDELFSLNFDMQTVADSEENKSFLFVIPINQDWEDELAGVALKGPEGSEAVDMGSAMSILRNPVTRQIRGFLPTSTSDSAAESDALVERALERGFEVLLSRGSSKAGVRHP